ncbi:hypothetical protein A1F94_003390 [Pyrenophora tritici-repentis]|nr:hypothetical protein A1F94_003390 [Pyrenophora tritici-repentis]
MDRDREPWRDSWQGYFTPDYAVNRNKSSVYYSPGTDPLIARTPVGPTAYRMHPGLVSLPQSAMAEPSTWNDSFRAPNNHEAYVTSNRQGNCSLTDANSITRGVTPTVHKHPSTPTLATNVPNTTIEGFKYGGQSAEVLDHHGQALALAQSQIYEKRAQKKAQEEAAAQAILQQQQQTDVNQLQAQLQEHAKKRKEEQLYKLQCQQPQDEYTHGRFLNEQERLWYSERYNQLFEASSHARSKITKPDRVVESIPVRATPPEGPTDSRPMPKAFLSKPEAISGFTVRSKVETAERTPECLPTCKASKPTVEAIPERIVSRGLETIEEATKAEADAICDFLPPPTRYKTAGKTAQPMSTHKASKPVINPVIIPSGPVTTMKAVSQSHIPKASEKKRSTAQWPKWTEGQDLSPNFESLSLASDIDEGWEEVEGELKEWEMLEH